MKCQYCPTLDGQGFPAAREVAAVNQFNDRACERHIANLWSSTALAMARRLRVFQ